MRLIRLQFAFTFQLCTGVVMVIRDGVKILVDMTYFIT